MALRGRVRTVVREKYQEKTPTFIRSGEALRPLRKREVGGVWCKVDPAPICCYNLCSKSQGSAPVGSLVAGRIGSG